MSPPRGNTSASPSPRDGATLIGRALSVSRDPCDLRVVNRADISERTQVIKVVCVQACRYRTTARSGVHGTSRPSDGLITPLAQRWRVSAVSLAAVADSLVPARVLSCDNQPPSLCAGSVRPWWAREAQSTSH